MTERIIRVFRDVDRWFWFAALTALTISVFLWWNYYCISVDGVRYVEAARNFYNGNVMAGLASVYPPGYPLLIALFYNFVNDWERAGQAVSVIARLLLLFPLYGLLRRVYSKSVAVVGCFLAALSPFLSMYSVHVRTESLFLFFAVFALYMFYRGMEERRTAHFFLGGLLSGFGYLVRPEAFGFVILIPSFLLLMWWIQKRWDFAWTVRASLLLVAGFLLFGAPYIAYLSHETGEWGTLSRKAGVTLAVSLREVGLLDEVAEDFPTRESISLPEFIKRQPWVYTKKVLGDIVPSIGIYFEALHYSYVPFLLLGIAGVFRAPPWRRKDFLLLAYLVFFIAAFVAIYVNRRYLVQLVPVSMGWTAVGALWIWHWAKTNWSERSATAVCAALGVIFLIGTLPKTLKPVAKDKAHFKEAGRYVRQRHGSGNLNVLASDNRIAFYAGAQTIRLRDYSSESDVAAQAQQRNASFLVADLRVLKTRFPDFLQSPERYGFRFEKEFVGYEKDRVFVYRAT
ncbi:MAG TPA: glycosyltransferase family 39 protein [Candidatus Binatia bacterium]|nr:glycosyltransferase family 39 protein [Candidatus Binatia bacterium]